MYQRSCPKCLALLQNQEQGVPFKCAQCNEVLLIAPNNPDHAIEYLDYVKTQRQDIFSSDVVTITEGDTNPVEFVTPDGGDGRSSQLDKGQQLDYSVDGEPVAEKEVQFRDLKKTGATNLDEDGERDVFDLQQDLSDKFLSSKAEAEFDVPEGVVVRNTTREVQNKKEMRALYSKRIILGGGIAFLGTGCAFGLFKLIQSSSENSKRETVQAKEVLLQNASESKIEPKSHTTFLAHKALIAYFKSSTLEEAKPYLTKAPHVQDALERYWKPYRYDTIALIPQATKNITECDTVMYMFRCQRENSDKVDLYPVYIREGDEYPLIDWQYPHQIEHVSLHDIVEGEFVGNVKVRAQITTDDYYNFGYEEGLSQSFFLSHPFEPENIKLRLPCYIETSSPHYKYLANHFKLAPKWLNQSYQKGVSLEQLESSFDVNTIDSKERKPFVRKTSRMILEIEVLEGTPKVAEIKKVITGDLVDYFKTYQYPYLK